MNMILIRIFTSYRCSNYYINHVYVYFLNSVGHRNEKLY